jgi:predicted lipoprotein with Yx(FWY)xxD motif
MRSLALLLASTIFLSACQNSGIKFTNPLAEIPAAKRFGATLKHDSKPLAMVFDTIRASDWRLKEGAGDQTASRGYRAQLKGKAEAEKSLNRIDLSGVQTALSDPDQQAVALGGLYASAPRFRAETGMAVTHFRNVLTTTSGMTLYTFSGDMRNTPLCVDDCNLRFQPYLVEPNAPSYREFGHAQRPEGYHQWAVKDQPLYTFIGDAVPGDRKGEGLESRWYAVPYPFEGGSPIAGLAQHMSNAPSLASAPIIPSLASPPQLQGSDMGAAAFGQVGAIPLGAVSGPTSGSYAPVPLNNASAPPVLQQSQAEPGLPTPPWPRSADGLPVAQPFYSR